MKFLHAADLHVDSPLRGLSERTRTRESSTIIRA